MMREYKQEYKRHGVSDRDYKNKVQILEKMWDELYFSDEEIENISKIVDRKNLDIGFVAHR